LKAGLRLIQRSQEIILKRDTEKDGKHIAVQYKLEHKDVNKVLSRRRYLMHWYLTLRDLMHWYLLLWYLTYWYLILWYLIRRYL